VGSKDGVVEFRDVTGCRVELGFRVEEAGVRSEEGCWDVDVDGAEVEEGWEDVGRLGMGIFDRSIALEFSGYTPVFWKAFFMASLVNAVFSAWTSTDANFALLTINAAATRHS